MPESAICYPMRDKLGGKRRGSPQKYKLPQSNMNFAITRVRREGRDYYFC